MLTHLQIRDFAIVERLELEFGEGMSVITGETGAGKSILVDALGLLLGDRADSGVVRHGAERTELSASFRIDHLPQVRSWLSEHGLDGGDECHLRRQVYGNGRSRGYINGISQPMQALRELGELLVDIHSQHEHQSLLKPDAQRQLLDGHAGLQALVAEVGGLFQRWSQMREQWDALQRADTERDARVEFLRFQVQELDALNLREGEWLELDTEQRRLANAGRLLEGGQRILDRLIEGGNASVRGALARLLAELQTLSTVDVKLGALPELLNAALIQIDEAGEQLSRYVSGLDLDPARLSWVESRLGAIHALARKQRVNAAELPERIARLRAELEALDNSEERRAQLAREMEQSLEAYTRAAQTLGVRRAAAARQLGEQVSAAMQDLGMAGGRFEIRLTARAKPAASGAEGVEFWVSVNPGQPPRPLAKVASGGELSRISLGIQVIAADAARIPTLIFDEVDSGVGGAVAEVVGQLLRRLGRTRQVLCVTHLPQVAAQAHRHFKADKKTSAGVTNANVRALDADQRTREVARMLGGLKLTERTLEHARELIHEAQKS
ncbi:MAG: DNA repair protein RecN [Gammaproteobacteria bacterium]